MQGNMCPQPHEIMTLTWSWLLVRHSIVLCSPHWFIREHLQLNFLYKCGISATPKYDLRIIGYTISLSWIDTYLGIKECVYIVWYRGQPSQSNPYAHRSFSSITLICCTTSTTTTSSLIFAPRHVNIKSLQVCSDVLYFNIP